MPESKPENKKGVKKTGFAKVAVKTAASRRGARGSAKAAEMLSNPAIAGAEDVVSRSFFGNPDVGRATADAQPGPGEASSPVPAADPAPVPAQGDERPAVPALDPGPMPSETPVPQSAPSHLMVSDESSSAPDATTLTQLDTAAAQPATVEPEPTTDKPAVQETAADQALTAFADPTPPARVPQRRSSTPAAAPKASKKIPGRGVTGGHRAVMASFTDARINSENWEMHGVKLEAGVKAALKTRVLADRRSSGIRSLAEGHYMDAALRALPDDPQAWVAMAKAFQADRFADPEIGKQTTYRVGPVAYELLANLNQAMQELNYGRRGLYVLSAAMERLLQEMDKDGPLTGRRD